MAVFRSSKDKPAFKVKEFPDMRMFMSAGLRYSLGRRSYAPTHFLEFLRKNLDNFHVYSLSVFKDDLTDFVRAYGDSKESVIIETLNDAKELIELINERLDE